MRIPRQIRKRHLPTKVIRKIEEIPIEEFNKIFPHVPEGYSFFKSLDESGFKEYSFYYILVYENKQLAGIAPCFTMHYGVKILACGNPLGQGQIGIAGFSVSVLEAIENRMGSLARKIRASFIAFKDFDASYDHLFETLLKNGFLKTNNPPMSRLRLDFTDLEEYLKTLSKASRYDLRRKFKKVSTIKIDPSVTSTLDENTLDDAYDLYCRSIKAAGAGPVPKEFFRRISLNNLKKTRFFCWRIKGKLIAFSFCLVSNDVLLDYFVGFDFTAAREYHLYFIKFKCIMEWCLTQGIKFYEMRPTGYETKRRLGFKCVPVYLYIKASHKSLQGLMKFVLTPFLAIRQYVLKITMHIP